MITKKIKYFIIFIMLLILSNNPVLANTNIIDFSKTGSIEITLKESSDNTPISGAKITVIEVASAISENNNLVFKYHENIKDCETDLSNFQNELLPKEIDKCIKNINLPSQTNITNNEGIVNFNELRLGLYLVKQTNEVEGYSKIDSFLVAIPQVEDNKWIYDIKSIPKTDIIRVMDLSVKKVWNTSNSLETHPQNVTIDLYKGTELIDTIILDEENNWLHTWNKIPLSDEYSVKEKNVPDEYTDTYRKEGNTFIVTNTKILVQTGINLLFVELLSLVGIILIILGIIFEKRKKYE